ncbi:hypothetical protein PGH45_19430, partial [Legionella pneumophila]|nr:hypothetical protein [Legionella pneumophila]
TMLKQKDVYISSLKLNNYIYKIRPLLIQVNDIACRFTKKKTFHRKTVITGLIFFYRRKR